MRSHNQQQQHWHGDETRWHVFATVEGKVGHLWYLWLMRSAEAAVFVLAAGRRWLPWRMTEAERAPWKLPEEAAGRRTEDSS